MSISYGGTVHGRDHPGRDDARRHRRRRAPRRRALRAPGRDRGGAAADRPAHPGRRRRARRPGVRHRGGQGDPGARPERLRDRPAARPALADRPRRARRHHRDPARSRGSTGSRPGRPSPPRCASSGLVVAERRPYTHAVGHCGRCDTVVEPRLSLQWFVKVEPLAEAAGDAVRDGRTAISPPEMAARLLRLGRRHARLVHQPSALVGPPHPGLVRPGRRGRRAARGRGAAAGEGWTQDPDVLDTWFSSALWPFSTLGWPDDAGPRDVLPDRVLVTGYDIIFFWVARMMMFGSTRLARGALPRRSSSPAWSATAPASKMSKSAGNVIDPLDWIDGVRRRRHCGSRWPAARTRAPTSRSARSGSRPPATSAPRCGTRPGSRCSTGRPAAAAARAARAVRARPVGALAAAPRSRRGRRALRRLRVRQGRATLYHFAWDEVCDWYVELRQGPIAAAATRRPRPARCSGTCSTGCCGCCTR